MAIPTGKYWNETADRVAVVYDPIYADGSTGRRQTCYLPWEGDTTITQAELLAAVQGYFVAKYGPGQDRIVSARLTRGRAACSPTPG